MMSSFFFVLDLQLFAIRCQQIRFIGHERQAYSTLRCDTIVPQQAFQGGLGLPNNEEKGEY
jgi:hypothetical protein